jgi:hypothetical protein
MASSPSFVPWDPNRGEWDPDKAPWELYKIDEDFSPANVPAKQYWSITAYDYETACFIREAPVISLDSYNQKTKKNADGSVDIYFAPQAPAGQENNWVTTAKGGQWFVIFRLYTPDKPFFDKTWALPDIEKINS